MGLSPTIRRSILLLIGSARSTSAAFMAASVYSNVLTFDPSETMPPSTTAIDPRAASRMDLNRASIVTSGTSTPPAIAALETRMIIRHHSETAASSSSSASIREISSVSSSSAIRFKIGIRGTLQGHFVGHDGMQPLCRVAPLRGSGVQQFCLDQRIPDPRNFRIRYPDQRRTHHRPRQFA